MFWSWKGMAWCDGMYLRRDLTVFRITFRETNFLFEVKIYLETRGHTPSKTGTREWPVCQMAVIASASRRVSASSMYTSSIFVMMSWALRWGMVYGEVYSEGNNVAKKIRSLITIIGKPGTVVWLSAVCPAVVGFLKPTAKQKRWNNVNDYCDCSNSGKKIHFIRATLWMWCHPEIFNIRCINLCVYLKTKNSKREAPEPDKFRLYLQ